MLIYRYAKTAKKVDMKRLKVVAWNILNQASIQVALASQPFKINPCTTPFTVNTNIELCGSDSSTIVPCAL